MDFDYYLPEEEIYHPDNPQYQLARIGVVKPFWAHRKSDRRETCITLYVPGYGSMPIKSAEQIRDALTRAIEKAKTLKLEKPIQGGKQP